MEFFEVEGATLLHWKMTVAAQDEYEALDGIPERIAACVASQPGPVTFGSLEHRVVRCEPGDLVGHD